MTEPMSEEELREIERTSGPGEVQNVYNVFDLIKGVRTSCDIISFVESDITKLRTDECGNTPRSKPSFATARLNVFCINLVPSDICCAKRTVYLAFLRDEDWPVPVVTMTVNTDERAVRLLGEHWVDWIETSPKYRRLGYAKELRVAVADRLPAALNACPGSIEGALFLTGIGEMTEQERDEYVRGVTA